MRNLLNQLLKNATILFVFSVFFISCQEEETIIVRNKKDITRDVKNVSIKEIPDVMKYLNQDISRKTRSINNSSFVITPFGRIPLDNIAAITDTLGNSNYTFEIIPKNYQKNRFYNLVITEDTEQNIMRSYVLEYKMDRNFANKLATGELDFNHFTGQIKTYDATSFVNAIIPASDCEEEPVIQGQLTACSEDSYEDGSSYGDTGDSPNEGESSNNGGNSGGNGGDSGGDGYESGGGATGSEGGGVICWSTLEAVECNGGGHHYGDSSCTGSFHGGIILIVYCSDGYFSVTVLSDKTSGGCNGINSNVSVNPTTFDKFATVILNLSEEQQTFLDENCDLKNDIYQFLNNHINPVNNDYEPEAVNFAIQAIEALMDGGEVDFDEMIIIDLSEREKCIYDLITNTPLYKQTIGTFNVDSGYAIYIKNGECSSPNADACTDANELYEGCITINIQNYMEGLDFAATLLHEAIHAELFKYIHQYDSGVEIGNREQLLYYYFYYKAENENTLNTALAQHQYMADNYVKPIAETMRQLDNNQYPLEYYMGFGWDGLRDYGYDGYYDNGNWVSLNNNIDTQYYQNQSLVNQNTIFANNCN